MDKNTITGLVLIAAVLIGFSYYSNSRRAAYQEELTQQALVEDSLAAVASEKAQEPVAGSTPTATIQQPDSSDIFLAAAVLPTADTLQAAAPLVLQNEKISVELSRKGGLVSAVRLKGYKSYADFHSGNNQAQLVLFDSSTAQMNLQFETTAGIYNSQAYSFAALSQTDSTATLALASSLGDTLFIDYALLPGTYMLNASVRTVGRSFKGKALGLEWQDRVRQQEKGLYFENMYSALTYREDDGDTEKLNEQKADEAQPQKKVQWVAFKNQYFSAVLIAPELMKANLLKSELCAEGSGFVKQYAADLELPFNAAGTQMQFYFGPNQYRYLQSMEEYRVGGREMRLEKLVYLGWPIVRWINRFFTIYVFDFLTGFGMNMGIVLLIITLLLRVIVYPTTRKSYLSSAKMRVLKPKVDALGEKYPKQEDAMKKQQEMMQLYQQYGVSPMGGCLPMLIQMPIWIAMFNFVPNAFELRQQSFLWADDLSTYDSLITFGTNVPWLGDHLSLFCILFCGTNILYSWMTMRQQRESMSGEQAQQMKVMQWMMFLMPVFFFFMFNKYSSGLNYYYFISLLASALTMWYLRRTTDDAKLLAKLEENYKANKNNPNRKPSGLAARLQALQEQQEELKKRQQHIGRR
ncbi:MAG: membrane protein insertase YidC [Alloprevotella sp.]|nr:membrane protein insertase YidC [Alloprevotella sp.]